MRTRLTHTLEVSQIARTIVSSLGCNLDLTEAIALGHDVGHTPFGHVGERTLNLILNNCEQRNIPIRENNLGFKHNLQSIRVLCDLEGELNLSKYTLWGIANHSKIQYTDCQLKQGICYSIHHPSQCQRPRNDGHRLCCTFYDDYLETINRDKYWSIEGLVVGLADEIAQRHHDIEDGLRYKILERDSLLNQLTVFEAVFSVLDNENYRNLKLLSSEPDDVFIANFSRLIVKAYVVNLVEDTKRRINEMGINLRINGPQAFRQLKKDISIIDAKNLVGFSTEFEIADKSFHFFLKSSILNSYAAQSMDGKGAFLIRRIFEASLSNPSQLPDDQIRSFYKAIHLPNKPIWQMRGEINSYRNTELRRNHLMRVIADYISGMTDAYAYNQFDLLYGTRLK